MPSSSPTPLRSQPETEAKARLVLLHGWGADADDLQTLGEVLARHVTIPLDVVALPAPELHPQGIGRQWYGLFPADWDAVPAAQADLRSRLLTLSSEGIPLEATVVLGFSQGAAMALGTGCELPLAGVIACSGYPHPHWEAPTHRPPVLLIHGRNDEVVPFSAAEELNRRLHSGEAPLTLEPFNGGHTIPEVVFPTITKALDHWLRATSDKG